MSFNFSKSSKSNLFTCDKRLIDVFETVIRHRDCTVLCGHRIESAQNQAYESGKSHAKWPNSKHNTIPSIAIDVAPYPINWDDIERFYIFANFVLGVAAAQNIKLKWGGDFKGFFDGPHYELIER